MDEFTSRVAPKPVPNRRGRKRAIIVAVCTTFALMALVCCYAATVVVREALNLIDAFFTGLGELLSAFILVVTTFISVVALPLLMDSLSRLAPSELIPFVVQLLNWWKGS